MGCRENNLVKYKPYLEGKILKELSLGTW